MKKTIRILLLLLALNITTSCKKSEDSPSIQGKWYLSSIDTKVNLGNCELKDTTENYNKDNTSSVFEFKTNDEMTIWVIGLNGSLVPFKGNYLYQNNNLYIILNSDTMETQVNNLSESVWYYKQDNFVWCPDKRAFTEHYNYSKY